MTPPRQIVASLDAWRARMGLLELAAVDRGGLALLERVSAELCGAERLMAAVWGGAPLTTETVVSVESAIGTAERMVGDATPAPAPAPVTAAADGGSLEVLLPAIAARAEDQR